MNDMTRIRDMLLAAGAEYDEEKGRKLISYMDAVLERNRHINLTAIRDREDFLDRHYADSLAPAVSEEFTGAERIIDVGTGAGFPGVPLAVAFPEKEFTLLDSLRKRLRIVRGLCDDAGIRNVRTVHGRAEDLGRDPDFRESFDLCVSRAVAALPVLSEYCLPFVKEGGCFIAYKGPDCTGEIEQAGKAIKALGGRIDRVDEDTGLSGGFRHTLIYVRKEGPTPVTYPRKAGTPSKDPIS